METQHEDRRLTTILAADVVGYSQLMAADESGTLALLNAHRRELIEPKTTEHHGRVVKLMGDGTLMEFGSVVDAVNFAVDVQKAVAERNADVPDACQIIYRIGINIGDIIVQGDDIYGDGVNVAARLEQLAEPGGICIARNVFDQVKNKLEISFQDMGEHELKNIPEPVMAYRIIMEDQDAGLAAVDAGEPLPLPDKPSIAVLAFDNMSGDPEQEFFADGIAEDVITALARFRSLFVIARNSSFTYKGGAVDITRVARELGVRYVVEGSVRKAGNRVRITAQLIDATSGNHLWANRYDRDLEDIFALQDEITREIVTALEVKLSEGEQVRLWRKRAGNVETYELFQRGREDHLLFTKEANAQGRQKLEGALKINPAFADAKAYLAFTHASAARYGWTQSRENSWNTALDLAKQAVAIDEQSGLAHSTLGWAQLFHREYEAALESTERAVTLNPNGADEYHLLAMVYCYSGRPEEAIDAEKQALRLNPLNPTNSLVELGRAYCQTGRYEDAIGPLTEVVARRPYWLSARLLLALAYYQISRENEASALVREILRSRPDFSINAEAETHPYKNSEDLKRYINGLRQAGLPE